MRNCISLMLLAIAMYVHTPVFAQAPPPVIDIYDSTTTLQDFLNHIKLISDPNDTGEGKSYSQIKFLEQFWPDRVVKNDANANATTNTNMFTQYFSQLHLSLLAKQSMSGCGGFQGNWRCIGPTEMHQQQMGRVDDVWASPLDSNHILAATVGGLFKTKNGGQTWQCITDEALISYGIMGITSIAVNPLDTNTIYLGTSGEYYSILNIISLGLPEGVIGGAGILKSFDGGQTWEQEFINGGYIERIQRIFFTPDSTRLYAFSTNKIYTRLSSGTTWQDITPPQTASLDWLDFDFVPNDQSHFFVVGRFNHPIGGGFTIPAIVIWESTAAVPSSPDWAEIASTISYTHASTTLTELDLASCALSIPDEDTLFIMTMPTGANVTHTHMALLKYNITGTAHQWTHVSIIPEGRCCNETFKIDLVVSPANTSNNNNHRVMYAGNTRPLISVNSGQTWRYIGNYHPSDAAPTHADIRRIYIQSATNSLRGEDDIVFVATDGGVSKKTAGRDINDFFVDSLSFTININGSGLTCGEFWGVDVSEEGGLVFGGQMHVGKQAYEPALTPEWVTLRSQDAYSTVFDKEDRTRAYGTAGAQTLDREVTENDNGRAMGTLLGSTRPSGDGTARENYRVPLFADEQNRHYYGIRRLWEGLGDFTTKTWSDKGVGFGLPNQGASPGVRVLAFTPYDSLHGYILYNYIDNSTSQPFFYRNPQNGPNFVPITNVPSTPWFPLTYVACDPQNPERVWASVGGISWETDTLCAHHKVRYSSDGGVNWYKIDKGLPLRMPVINLVYQEGGNRLFAATDVGIYTCDMSTFNPSTYQVFGNNDTINTSVEWTCFSEGTEDGPDFPNCYVTELKINYCDASLYAGTYGRSVWRTNLNESMWAIPPSTLTHVTIDDTWDVDKYLTGNVLVDSGVTLTINNEAVIHMPRNGHITLQPGAELIITDSARITNSCENCFWWGIVARGTTNEAQQPVNNPKHAVVRMTNGAVLENARRAVSLLDFLEGDPAKSGGVLQAFNSSFINNKASIDIRGYAFDNKSVISNCTFEINNNYRGHNVDAPFGAHMIMIDVNGVDIKGCTFLNNDTFSQNRSKGIGIYALNAGFSVLPICSGFPCSYQRSTFEGFRHGINIYGGYDNPTAPYITHADFDRNTVGIRVIGKNDVTAVNSTFHIGRGLPANYTNGEGGIWYEPSCPWNVGIYTHSVSRFTIEDNEFHGHPVTGTVSVGTATISSGNDDKMIYRCTFDSCGHACVASRVNGMQGGWVNPATLTGLRYICNSFTDDVEDIHIAAYPNYTLGQSALAPEGIAAHQAAAFYSQTSTWLSAGNIFNGATTNIINEGHPINYYGTGGSGYPALRYGEVGADSSSASNTCPSKFDPDLDWEDSHHTDILSVSNMKARWDSVNTTRGAALSTYQGLIDGGNTASLISYIGTLSPTPPNMATLNSLLSGYSPYLSPEAVIASFNVLVIPSDRSNLVLANPDILRDDQYYDYLTRSVSPAFSSGTIAAFDAARSTVTSRGEDELNIAIMTAEMSNLSRRIISACKRDTTRVLIDSLPSWYLKHGTLESEYSLVGHYFSLGDVTTAQTILDDIPNKFELSDREEDYFAEFDSVFLIAKSIIDDSRKLTEPEAGEIDAINNIITTGSHEIAIFCQKFFGADILTEPPTSYSMPTCLDDGWIQERPANNNSNQTVPPIASVLEYNEYLIVSPNPAKDNVLFTYNVPDATGKLSIQVSTSVGQTVKSFALPDKQGRVNWSTVELAAGTYIYKLFDDRGNITTGKLLITK